MAITIRNLIFNYHNHRIFDNINLEIEDGKITCLIGPNGSGKSTLVKILLGLLRYNGYIKINDKILTKDTIKEVRKQIGVVFENPDNQFVAETVMDDIAFTLENMNYDKKIIRSKIEEITRYLGIYDLLERNPHSLSGGQKQMVALASALVHEPNILILDEAFTMIDQAERKKIETYLKELKITILLVTPDMEDTLLADNIIVLNAGKVVMNDTKENVYKQEKALQSLGFDLPFIASLSARLQFYNLLDTPVYDMEEMVDTLWK